GGVKSSLSGEASQEVLQLLLLLVLGGLELLDVRLILLDGGFLLVELLQVALVGLRRAGHLPQVGPQATLVLSYRAQLPLQLGKLALGLGHRLAQLERLLEPLLDPGADDGLAQEQADLLVGAGADGPGLLERPLLADAQGLGGARGDLELEAVDVAGG